MGRFGSWGLAGVKGGRGGRLGETIAGPGRHRGFPNDAC